MRTDFATTGVPPCPTTSSGLTPCVLIRPVWLGASMGCMAHQMQKQNESCVWLTEPVFGPGHACANSRSRPGPPDTAVLRVPGEPGARHSRARVSRPPQSPLPSRAARSLSPARPPQSPLPLELLSPSSSPSPSSSSRPDSRNQELSLPLELLSPQSPLRPIQRALLCALSV